MKRALCGVAAVATIAFAASPALTATIPAPHTRKAALKILRADVTKIARDYAHRRYRAVCSDLTLKERRHLGGASQCMLKIALINAFVPIKRFTITTAKLAKNHARGTVSLYVNGNKKHLVHAVVKWQGGRYRLDHQSGWHPTL